MTLVQPDLMDLHSCALEVNQGWFRNNGIHSGDKVESNPG